MKRYSFLIFHKDYAPFIQQVRDLGVVHVIEKSSGAVAENSALQEILQKEDRINRVVKQLRSCAGDTPLAAAAATTEAEAILARFDTLTEEISKEQHQQVALKKETDRMRVWGNFDLANIERLATSGYTVQLYSCSASSFDPAWVAQYNAMVVATEGSTQHFITVTPVGEEVVIEQADMVRLPQSSLSEMEQELTASLARQAEATAALTALATGSIATLEAYLLHLKEEFDLLKVELNTDKQAEDKLLVLEGWVPAAKGEALDAFLNQQAIYYQSAKPTEEDNVPILLKNNAFTRLFEVIGELYDMPNYHEMDLTPFFAPFFVMFFGLCLGDAGYGLLITIGALIARSKVDKGLKPFMTLAAILGMGTVLFGTISGTLFGINMLEVNWAWVKNLKQFMMNPDQLFNFALIVGVCQILFGMVIRAVGSTKRYGFMKSLSAWGWLILLVGCGATYGMQAMGMIPEATAQIGYYVVGGVASIGIFLFNDIKRNPLVNIGSGLWDTYNMATGLLGDLLSYIRLFALGISGSVMGLVFNDLAMSLTESMPIVVAQIVMVLILLAGHGMNIFMNGLGAFVHPMRLTFVEFYKNAGFEGGGKKYTPFARRAE